MNGTIYNTKTGEIYTAMYGPDEESIKIQLPLYDNAAYLLGVFLESDQWYLPEGVKTPRPTMAITRSASAVPVNTPFTLTGLPPGTRAIGRNFDTVIEDGTLEWSAAEPGTYTIELICFPYQPQVITLEITET